MLWFVVTDRRQGRSRTSSQWEALMEWDSTAIWKASMNFSHRLGDSD